MQAVPPSLQELAQRLRRLRQEHWPDVRLTQGALARALGGDESLAAATVSSWENPSSPKLPPRDRVIAYARFFATRRSVEDEPRLIPVDTLTDEERRVYQELEAELLELREAAGRPFPTGAVHVRRSWYFSDSGPATLVCAQLPEGETGSMANPADPNYTELLSYADLDAMVELHGHIRAENPSMGVFYKAAPNVVPDDLSGHVVLLGGITWNEITKRLSAMTPLPVRQVRDTTLPSGDVFVTDDNEDQPFLPIWADAERTNLVEDVGFFARVPNPLNSSRTLTICNGIHSRGVLGAVRSLTDARLRDTNERYISARFGDAESFVILMRVPVIGGKAMTPDFNIEDRVLYQWSKGAGK